LKDLDQIEPQEKTLVFIMRPDYDTVSEMISKKNHFAKADKDIHILFIPRRTIECDELLFDANILG
jgi:hypothetical protein